MLDSTSVLLLFLIALCAWLAYSRTRSPPSRTKPNSNYNGFIYERIVDPMIAGMHSYIAKQVEANSTVVECCCGTGQLSFKLSVHCKQVLGVDLSPKMINVANRKKSRYAATNVEFELGDVTETLKRYPDKCFDYATVCMALHEMPKIFRAPMLREMGRVAKTVIAVDYSVNMPVSLSKFRNLFLEFIAGGEHYVNFKEFRREGGLESLAAAAGLKITNEKLLDKKCVTVLYLQE